MHLFRWPTARAGWRWTGTRTSWTAPGRWPGEPRSGWRSFGDDESAAGQSAW